MYLIGKIKCNKYSFNFIIVIIPYFLNKICSFLETSVPLLVLIEAAHSGDEKEVEECALVFTEHANKLVEVN